MVKSSDDYIHSIIKREIGRAKDKCRHERKTPSPIKYTYPRESERVVKEKITALTKIKGNEIDIGCNVEWVSTKDKFFDTVIISFYPK